MFRGLTFKVFMILFISFAFVFSILFVDKYNNYYKELISRHENSQTNLNDYASYLAGHFNDIQKSNHPENYTIEALKKDLRNAPKSTNATICLLDQDFHVIEKTGFQKNDNYLYITMLSTQQTYNSDTPVIDHYYIDLSSLTSKQLSLLEKNIKTNCKDVYFDGDIQEINDVQYKSIYMKDIQEKYYIVYPTYFHINEDILGSMVQGYARKGSYLGYIREGQIKEFNDTSLLTDGFVDSLSYQQVSQLMKKTIDEHFSELYIHYLVCSSVKNNKIQLNRNDLDQIQKLMEDQEIFQATLKKVNQNNSYMIDIQSLTSSQSEDLLAGYLVCFYDFSHKGSASVIQTLYEDNKVVIAGVILFILCFSYLISYMMTRRIKQIDQVAMQIADNHFDVKLSTHGHDELSSLSSHINTMSFNLKKNINQLQLEIDQVKKMESLRKEFVAQFTHEIKTPLAIMNGNLDLLEETDDPIKKERYFSIINKEIEMINDLVLQMLELSKLEAKAIILDKQTFNFTELCEDIIDEYEQLLKDKHLLIDLKAQDVSLYGDQKRIAMVVQNFLSNAIKHATYHSTIFLTIENNMFSIENEGNPIDEKMKEKIWQSFVSDDHQGTGLGLAICRHILELHDMHYNVKNTKKGVMFSFKWRNENE